MRKSNASCTKVKLQQNNALTEACMEKANCLTHTHTCVKMSVLASIHKKRRLQVNVEICAIGLKVTAA